jgi:xanthine dehydrogenase iron-sulfur cluster and FAD-binding subunit A
VINFQYASVSDAVHALAADRTCRSSRGDCWWGSRKIGDRLSEAFALVSIAAALGLAGDRIKTARLALAGVAHEPHGG